MTRFIEMDVFAALCKATSELDDVAACGEGATYGPLDESQVARVRRAFELLEDVLLELQVACGDVDADVRDDSDLAGVVVFEEGDPRSAFVG